MDKLVTCKTCGSEIAKNAKTCPKCGAPQKKHTVLYVILAILGILVVSSAMNGGKKASGQNQPAPPPAISQNIKEQGESKSEEEIKKPAVPQEYLNALSQAQTYSDKMHMSRMGIYDQLTSEYGGKFPPEAAQYAIDNVVADFNENALETAKSYYNKMNMSKEDIRDQLTSAYGERFTQDQADYAIEHLDQ